MPPARSYENGLTFCWNCPCCPPYMYPCCGPPAPRHNPTHPVTSTASTMRRQMYVKTYHTVRVACPGLHAVVEPRTCNRSLHHLLPPFEARCLSHRLRDQSVVPGLVALQQAIQQNVRTAFSYRRQMHGSPYTCIQSGVATDLRCGLEHLWLGAGYDNLRLLQDRQGLGLAGRLGRIHLLFC